MRSGLRIENEKDSLEWELVLPSVAFNEVMLAKVWAPDGSTGNYKRSHVTNTPTIS